MSFSASRSFYVIYTLAAVLFRFVFANTSPEVRSSKVLGLAFDKQRVPGPRTKDGLLKRQKSLSATIDNELLFYLINITVGTPPQSIRVGLATGIGDTWILAAGSDACDRSPDNCTTFGSFDSSKSSSFQEFEQDNFKLQIVGGPSVQGDLINDTLTIGKTAILQGQTMGLVNVSSLIQGLLGIGYVTEESIANGSNINVYPNVVANLQSQGLINTQAYSLWLNDLDSSTGSILFGGIDTAKFRGGLSVLPIATSPTKKTYDSFTVTLASVSLADASGKIVITQDDLTLPVLLDSGTTASLLPDTVVNPILRAIGAVNDSDFTCLVPCNITSSPASLSFGFGGAGGPVMNIPFAEFVFPARYLNGSSARFQNGREACGFGLLSTNSPPYVLGDTFLRSVYAVFDLDNNQIGLAPTVFNSTDSNIVEISGSALPSATATVSGAPNFSGKITDTASLAPFLTAASATIDLVGTPTSKGSGSATTSSGFAASASNESNHHSLSRSAKLGIGLGVWYGLAFLAIVGFLLYRFGRHRGRGGPNAAGAGAKGVEKKQLIRGGDAQPKFEGDDSPRRVGA